jgi:prepilin-type processing-associated H-X9-DG protein
MAPVELRAAPGGTALVVAWPDGTSATLAAGDLRRACRCAECTAAADAAVGPSDRQSPAIVAVAPIGGYAVNIGFSDGHARGIYPWALLRELGGG